jgi:hypothetical protein
MPQGKCAFCGTFVTSGGTALGKHSVACSACTPLAMKWLEKHAADRESSREAPADATEKTEAQ